MPHSSSGGHQRAFRVRAYIARRLSEEEASLDEVETVECESADQAVAIARELWQKRRYDRVTASCDRSHGHTDWTSETLLTLPG